MDYLNKNLEALQDKCPEVVKWFNEQNRDERVELISSKTGDLNLRIRGKEGKSILFYNIDDPVKDNNNQFKNINLSSDKITLILGIGLGYSAKYILENMDRGHKIVVFENNATILRYGLSLCDFSKPILDNAIYFSLTDDDSIKNCVKRYAAGKYQEDLLYVFNNKLRQVNQEYEKIDIKLTESVNSVLVGTMTGLQNAQRFIMNDFRNFTKFLYSTGINQLHPVFKNVPAIIISAGPSLEKNIHYLNAAKGKAVLFAVAPVVKVLLAYDIIPDFIVSIDFLEINYQHFQAICDLEIPLIHPNTIYHKIVEKYQGHAFVYQDGSGLSELLRQHWPFKGLGNPGGSVALHAFASAIVAGCDPVIFVGQDLAYSDQTHMRGTSFARAVDINKNNKNLVWLEGFYGEKVPSNPTLVSYLRRLEEIIASIDVKCINATEGGAAIKGTEPVALQEAVKQYCLKSVPIGSLVEKICAVEPVNYPGIIDDLEGMLERIADIRNLIAKGLQSNKEIECRIKNGMFDESGTDDAIIENYKISTKIQNFCEGFILTASFLRKEIIEINRSKYKYELDQINKKKEIRIGLKRNKMILKAADRVLKNIKSELVKIFRRMKAIDKHHKKIKEEGDHFNAHYGYGRFLAGTGLHRPAIKEYLKAFRIKVRAGVHFDLGKSYLAIGDIKSAKKQKEKYVIGGGSKNKAAKLEKMIDATVAGWLELAEDNFETNRWIDALLYSRKLEKAGSHRAVADKITGWALKARDKQIKSITCKVDLDSALHDHKKRYDSLLASAKGLMNSRNFDEAIKAFQELSAMKTENFDPVEARSLLGCCYSEKNEIQKAKKIFAQLNAKYPETGVFHLNLGRGYIRNGLYQEAIREYKAAAQKESKYYFLQFEIGSLYMSMGAYQLAVDAFEKYLKYSPDSYELIAKIGTCYFAMGQPAKAKANYRQALKIKPGYEAAQKGMMKIKMLNERIRLNKLSGSKQPVKQNAGGF